MKDVAQLLEHLRGMPPPRLLVLGDVMLDRYTWGSARRISPEAPVPVLTVERCEVRLGGAASVAALLRGWAAEVHLLGVCGEDGEAQLLKHLLHEAGIANHLLSDSTRPTTSKQRLLGLADGRHVQQLLRVDHESTRPLDPDRTAQLLAAAAAALPDCQAVLISDYGKGVCTPELLRELLHMASEHGVCVLVDPARGADSGNYAGARLLKPNRLEAQLASGLGIDGPRAAIEAAQVIRQRETVSAVVVTLDGDGLVLVDESNPAGIHLPARQREVYDITGAGDMALAALGLALAGGASHLDAARFANLAAGAEVEKWGVAPVSWDELAREVTGSRGRHAKILPLDELLGKLQEHRQRGQSLVFTNGCFDLLHVGHVTYLQHAAELGDILVVAVNSDASVRRLKGAQRPVFAQEQRSAMLAALHCVDYVLLFEEDTPHRLLRAIQPDVLVKGGTYTPEQVIGREIVEQAGGRVAVVGLVDGMSTTRIVESLNRAPEVSRSQL